jgi:hypothetical protein
MLHDDPVPLHDEIEQKCFCDLAIMWIKDQPIKPAFQDLNLPADLFEAGFHAASLS